MKTTRTALVFLAMLTTSVTASACADAGSDTEPADSDYYFATIAQMRKAHVAWSPEPATLAEALPRSSATMISKARSHWSDLAVMGKVTNVQPEYGIHYPDANPGHEGNEEARAVVVDFFATEAHERVLTVTISPKWVTGAVPGSDVTLTLGTNPDLDPQRFVESITSLDQVFAVVAQRRDGRNAGELYPILNGALLGSVGADGSLSFSGLGDTEDQFLSGMDTLAEVQAAVAR